MPRTMVKERSVMRCEGDRARSEGASSCQFAFRVYRGVRRTSYSLLEFFRFLGWEFVGIVDRRFYQQR
jgi:hypothetical protein